MKIMICTSRIRPDGEQTVFPPLGAMAIVQTLIKAGYEETSLFDIDGLRPPYEDVVRHFQQVQPDIVGISGVVSTSYRFIKQIIATLHEILPNTPVIVGGNVAASSEILLKIAKADYCVIGEGELAIVDLVNYLNEKGGRASPDDYNTLRRMAGITFLDEDGTAFFTGYRPNIPADGLYDLDYDLLERDTDINRYIIEPWFYVGFAYDNRSYESHRSGKKLATLVTTKGCVARCTFCHRWDKGIRFVGVDRIIQRIQMLQERYNVGYISFADENFGSNRKWVDELLEKIAPLDILWRVGGVRCRTVDIDMLQRMREAGCVNTQYGIESGSQRMLDVMEKNTQVEHNVNAAKFTYQAGLYTVYSMVLGMPGECPETIKETVEFLKDVTEFLPEPPYGRLSLNRLEALPGTPVYEYGKLLGLIGKTPEEEEKYLLHISDTSGGEAGKQLNFTDYPDFIVQSWFRLLWIEVLHNWYQKHPESQTSLLRALFASAPRLLMWKTKLWLKRYPQIRGIRGRQLVDTFVDKDFNTRRDELYESMIRLKYNPKMYFLRHFVVLEAIVRDLFNKEIPKGWWLRKLRDLVVYYINGPKSDRFNRYQSMRKTMTELRPEAVSSSEENLLPLQLGR